MSEHFPNRRAFLQAALVSGGALAFAGAQEAKTSRELAIDVERALAANPAVYPRELVERCVVTATEEIKACKPDPAIVARLAALPDNSWLDLNQPECKGTPQNHHSFPYYRGEGSATYDATTQAFVCFAGCGAPQYSNDLWVYKTGANRWFEVWPNIPRNYRPDFQGHRPPAGCTLGLAHAAETGCVYHYTCANTGKEGRNVWEIKIVGGRWQIVGRAEGGSGEGLRIVADPVLHGLLTVDREGGTRLFSFQTKQWIALAGDGPKPGVCYPLTYLAKHGCALLYLKGETWLFHSQDKRWKRLQTRHSPEGHYRAGIAYDAKNDVVLLGGWKTNEPSTDPDVTPGLWAFDPSKKEWHFAKPATGPKGRFEYFAYDPEYNVAITAGNAHGTWAYRYKS